MVPLEDGDQLAGDLNQGLHALGGAGVPLAEGLIRLVKDVDEDALQHGQLVKGRGGEGGVVPLHGGGVVGDVHCVIPQPLKLCRHLVILVQNGDVVGELELRQELHHILADLVGHMVDLVLLRLDLHVDGGVILLQQPEGLFDVAPGGPQNGEQKVVAALQGQGRGVEEHGVQSLDPVLVGAFLHGFVLHQPPAQLFIGGDQGQQGQGAAQVEDGVGIGDDAGVDGPFPKTVQ